MKTNSRATTGFNMNTVYYRVRQTIAAQRLTEKVQRQGNFSKKRSLSRLKDFSKLCAVDKKLKCTTVREVICLDCLKIMLSKKLSFARKTPYTP